MTEEFFLNRPTIEVDEYKKVHDELIDSINSDLLSQITSMSFLMLKPDAYLRGFIPSILNRIQEYDIYPIKYSLLDLSENLIDNLYMFVKQKYYDTWWVMKKAYTLAPCLPIMVIGNPATFPHLSARLRNIIGPTTPAAGRSGQLRYDYRATHRVFNLIHGTDDPGSAIRESLVFFNFDEIRDVLEIARKFSESKTVQNQDFSNVQYSDLVPKSTVDLGFERIKLNVRKQLLSKVESLLVNYDEKLVTYLSKLQSILIEEKTIINQELPLSEEAKKLNLQLLSERVTIFLLDRVIDLQRQNLARSETPINVRSKELASLTDAKICLNYMSLLTDKVEYGLNDFDNVIASTLTTGINLSQIEDVILHTGWAVTPQELYDIQFTS